MKKIKKMQSGGKAVYAKLKLDTADSTKYYKNRDTLSAEARKGPIIKKAVKKMQNGGSLSGLKASTKRVGPVDPNGAWTKVQKKTLAGARGKAVLKKDKELDASRTERK
jgi:hypothetical protein